MQLGGEARDIWHGSALVTCTCNPVKLLGLLKFGGTPRYNDARRCHPSGRHSQGAPAAIACSAVTAPRIVDALLTLRDDVEKALSGRAKELKHQLSMLGHKLGHKTRVRGSSLKGRKVAVKYRDKSGNTWAGRGAQPVWLRERLKGGGKLEDFAVQKTAASRKASPRKTKRAHRGKR